MTVIRDAVKSDARALARVHIETWRTTYRGIIPQAHLDGLSIDDRAARWEQILAKPEHGKTELNLVACDERGELVGFAGTGPLREPIPGHPDLDWELYAVYLLEGRQRSGIGRALVTELSRRTGKALLAWVLAANPACRFYEKLGGVVVATKTKNIGGADVAEVGYRLPLMSEEKTRWEDAYKRGDHAKHWEYSRPSQELVATVAATGVPQEGVALDVGCGSGTETVFLARAGFRTIGVDVSPTALGLARERAQKAGVKVDFKEGSVLALPVETSTVDFVNDRGVLHHIPEKDRSRYAEELHRVMVPNGVALIRGSATGGHFVAIEQETIDRHFSAMFIRSAVLPITLVSDAGTLESNLVVLRKREA